MVAGMKPIYVFDGQPPDLKKQELAKRYSKRADATDDLAEAVEAGNKEEIEKFSKRTVKVTKQHNDDCKRLLKLMGVHVCDACIHNVYILLEFFKRVENTVFLLCPCIFSFHLLNVYIK